MIHKKLLVFIYNKHYKFLTVAFLVLTVLAEWPPCG